VPRICAALFPFTAVLLAITPGTAGAADIGPGKPDPSGVSLLEVGRWILIVLAFAAIIGALVVKIRAARTLRRNARDHNSAS
jgi:hypothetical protein